MALTFADRVKETSTTAGTGTLTLAGAMYGFQSFAAIGNANTTYYAIYDNSSGDWEVGIGTYTASGTTLSRDTILSSSNAGAAVVFSSATKEVFVTYPSERSVYKDAANSIALTTGTANSVAYLNGSKVLTTGSALTFDGAILGVNEVSVGRGAGAVNTNTAVGASALAANTTGANNTAVGNGALRSNTTGGDNAAMGAFALYANTTANNNTAMGNAALYFNTTGNDNTAMGNGALQNNTTGANNVAVGRAALQSSTTGANNVAIGRDALGANTTGFSNTAVGRGALSNVTTGLQNTAVGVNAGSNLTTGLNNTVIGNLATASANNVNNEITLGNSSIATLRCQVTTITSLSDARDKANVADLSAGLDFVNALRPVKFDWNMRDGGKVGIPDTGFIAQDLQAVQATTGVDIPGLVYAANPDKLEAGYGKLIPVLVKAAQELSAEVERLKSQIKGT